VPGSPNLVSVVLQDFTLKRAFHFIDGLLGSAVLRIAQTVTAAWYYFERTMRYLSVGCVNVLKRK
jgi:hypothetical protein